MDNRGLKVGDYLECSWGYDQTNIDYYKVVALVGKTMVSILPVSSKLAESDNDVTSQNVVPGDEERESDVLLGMNYGEVKPVNKKAVDGRVTIRSGYYWAYKWDGSPSYETALGYGH